MARQLEKQAGGQHLLKKKERKKLHQKKPRWWKADNESTECVVFHRGKRKLRTRAFQTAKG